MVEKITFGVGGGGGEGFREGRSDYSKYTFSFFALQKFAFTGWVNYNVFVYMTTTIAGPQSNDVCYCCCVYQYSANNR